MKELIHVQIFLYDHFLLTSAASFYDTFMMANRISEVAFRGRWKWKVDFISVKGGKIQSSSGIQVVTKRYQRYKQKSIILIPGLDHLNVDEIIALLPELSSEIQFFKNLQEPIYASCSAGYLLAESGKLNSCSIASSWWLHSDFSYRYPKVQLQMDKLIVRNQNITTSGGAFSSIDLALRSLTDTSKEILSKSVANILAVDPKRELQSPYKQWLHNSQATWILKLERKLLSDLSYPWQIEDLAEITNLHPRTLFRKMKLELNLTPKKYLEKLRIQKAKQMLANENLRISDLCYHCGYEDLSHFQKVFKKTVGMSPGEYRDRFIKKR
ncbi:GlxA family transcriptional regulator [Leptospira bouyouniensis]|uniref:Helix-turn-helix domain-containing protein n=1 Tax=Leptospira bouyouniensis TaxID=2484911 RepID=A0ABY2LAR9_9LEPT|nr:helix-turn-helix domain-containing protein [Leptospira bouyouniensis]TGK52592.1 helix-turn-helix domain-containing protein [Leptospira bouyouniensis]